LQEISPNLTAPSNAPAAGALGAAPQRGRGRIIAILAAALLIRVPFFQPAIFYSDSIEFARGALWTYAAHSPGYVGYCMLGWFVDQFVHNIAIALALISLATTMAAIHFVYRLALAMELGTRTALASAAIFAASFCTLHFSVVALNYAVEGMVAALVGWIGIEAIGRKSWRLALLATFFWAAGGAIRESTTLFLFPLVVWIVLKTDRRLSVLMAHALLALPIIVAVVAIDRHFRSALNGYAPPVLSTIEDQALMSAGYDAADTDIHAAPSAGPYSYHWPSAELLDWFEQETGIRLIHQSVPWPQPSIRHALTLFAVYAAKCGYFLLLSMPILLAVPVCYLMQARPIWPRRDLLIFAAIWIAPAMAYFLFAHFGTYGYLQILLPIITVMTMAALVKGVETAQAPFGKRAAVVVAILGMAGAVVWVTAGPLRGGSNWDDRLNLLVLQDTGRAITSEFSINRRGLVGGAGPVPPTYASEHTDQQWLDQYRHDMRSSPCAIPIPDRVPYWFGRGD
jgi:hypothetical protein